MTIDQTESDFHESNSKWACNALLPHYGVLLASLYTDIPHKQYLSKPPCFHRLNHSATSAEFLIGCRKYGAADGQFNRREFE